MRHGRLEIFNLFLGCILNRVAFRAVLKDAMARINLVGRGGCLYIVFNERLW